MAAGKPFLSIGKWVVSDDGRWLAYLVDDTGFRQYVLHVRDLKTGQDGVEAIPRVTSVAWAADGRTLFYATEDATTKRSDTIFRHQIGDGGPDTVVLEEKDERFNLHRRADPERGLSARRVLEPHHHGGSIPGGAQPEERMDGDRPSGSGPGVLRGPPGRALLHPGERPRPQLPSGLGAGAFSGARAVAGGGAGTARRRAGLGGRVRRAPRAPRAAGRVAEAAHPRPRGRGQAREVTFSEPTYGLRDDHNEDFRSRFYRFAYQSMVSPKTIIDVDLRSGAQTIVKRQEIPGGFDPAHYRSEYLHATAPDGTQIPISIVYRVPLERDGQRPLWITGYGSYGNPFEATFEANRLPMLDRGFVMAIAHVRGGGEFGKTWHDAGRMANKANSFTDFIAATEFLQAQGYGRKERTVASGGSAGDCSWGRSSTCVRTCTGWCSPTSRSST